MKKKPAIDFKEFRFLPVSRNAGRPESLWLCDNLRCGAPVGAQHAVNFSRLRGVKGQLHICDDCAIRSQIEPFTFSISEAA